MSEFRKEISREEFHSLAEQLIGAPVKGARIVEIDCHIHTIDVFTVAHDEEDRAFLDDKGNVARHCHTIRVGGGQG